MQKIQQNLILSVPKFNPSCLSTKILLANCLEVFFLSLTLAIIKGSFAGI